MWDMKRGEQDKCVFCFCSGGGVGPLPGCAGGPGWDFSREGARPGPGPRSSSHPTPHPSLLQGTAKAKPSSGRDYVYWADLWRERARYRPGVAEKPKRSGDPMAAEGRAMPMALMSPFLHPRVAESGRQWTAVGVGPWPFPG